MLGCDTGATIGDLEERARARGEPAAADFDLEGWIVACTAVFERIFAQVPDDLAQLTRVGPDLDVARGRKRAQPGGVVLHGLGELLEELADPRLQIEPFEMCVFALGQAQHVVDDAAHAIGVVANDIGQAAFLESHDRRFCQQLPGVAHRTDRIANFVRDAGAEPAQCSQLRLLDLFGQQARVLEKDEDRRRSVGAQGREVCPDDTRAVRAHEGLVGRWQGAA